MNKFLFIGFILLLIGDIIQLFYTTNKLLTIGITIITFCIVICLAMMYNTKEKKNEN